MYNFKKYNRTKSSFLESIFSFEQSQQGPRSKCLSGGAKDERVSQIGVGGGNAWKVWFL